jgi:hypothetical protein
MEADQAKQTFASAYGRCWSANTWLRLVCTVESATSDNSATHSFLVTERGISLARQRTHHRSDLRREF